MHCILLEPDAIATLAKPGTPQGSDHGDIAGFARWQRHRCTSSEATRHERQKPHQRTVHPPTAGPTTCHRAPISGTAGLLHILPNKCGAAGDFQEASVINDDARPDGKDQMLVMRSNDGVFLRWFAQADGFAQLLHNTSREDDDCVVFSAGGVRIEVSLHATAADCLRAREDTIRQAKERGREMALAVAKPGGSA